MTNGNNMPVDSRDRELARTNLGQNYIVEAAAGTGKTTLLVGRILSLITKAKAAPEDIVAITFTERAAAELKMRLQEELGKALLEAPEKASDHLAMALAGFERMQVTTIHSFCATLLRERPVEAGIDPNFEVADGLMASLIAGEAWEDWIAREMDGDDPVLRRAVLIGVTLENMSSLADTMVENRDVLEHLPEPVDLAKTLAAYEADFKKAVAELKAMRKSGCKDPGDKGALAIDELEACVGEIAAARKASTLEEFVLEKLDINWRSNWGSKTKWESEAALTSVKEGIAAALDLHERAGAVVTHNTITELAQKLRGYVQAYEKAKDNQEVLDFQDLLIFARDMLARHTEVRRYFARRYKYILVDEFQDTDPLQAEIIFFLSEKTPGKARAWEDAEAEAGRVFLVGDPKQSIYRFRRADIEMYASAKAKLGKKQLLNIHQNFRCAPSIVDSANTIFGDLIQKSEDGDYQPEYVALDLGRREETFPERHGVVLLHPPENIAGEITNAPSRRMYEARAIAAFIQTIMKEKWPVYDKQEDIIRPVELRDIAILMETHAPLPALEDAMRLYRVDYRVIGGKYFYSRQEVQQLAAVLRSIENPYDTVAFVAALRSPFFGISDEEIFLRYCKTKRLSYLEGAAGTALEHAVAALRDLHEVRNDVSVEELLHRLYDMTKAPVTYLLKPGGEQRVANLLKIADTARALYERGVCTLRGFVTWLKDREAQEAEEAEAITVEAGDDFVRILTMHKAKGLEFPVTILTDLARVPRSRTEEIIIDRVNSAIAISLGKRGGIRTINFDGLKEYEDRRSKAEDLRLLYVSMTRARDFLVLPAYWAADSERLKAGGLRNGSTMKTLEEHVPPPGDTEHPPEGMIVFDTSRLDLNPKEPPAFRLPLMIEKAAAETDAAGAKKASKAADATEDHWLRSREQVAALAGKGRALATPTGSVEFDGREGDRAATVEAGQAKAGKAEAGSGDGLAFGKLVHGLLEAADWSDPGDLEALASGIAQEVGASEEMITKSADMVREALKSDLIGRILESDACYKEVPFAVSDAGAVLEGKIDVLFTEGDGIYVVDFKTDRVTAKDTKARAEHYRPQAEAYARAVEAACGRPPHEVAFFFLHPMESVRIS